MNNRLNWINYVLLNSAAVLADKSAVPSVHSVFELAFNHLAVWNVDSSPETVGHSVLVNCPVIDELSSEPGDALKLRVSQVSEVFVY